MPLYIRDDRVRELAQELAAHQGKSVTDAVRTAARGEAKAGAQAGRTGRRGAGGARGAPPAAPRAGARGRALRRQRTAAAFRLVIDTSAVSAILNDQPEAERFHALLLANEPLISCGTLLETFRVVQLALGPGALTLVDRLLAMYRVEQAPVDAGQVALAREAMLAYGKGRGAEPAVLNFGDLFACALARQLQCPLLFKGEDFARTDVEPVP